MKQYLELKMDNLIMRGYEDEQQLDKCVVFFHGFTGNKTETNRMFVHITDEFKTIKMSSIRLDWFGHGESDLDFSEITMDLLLKQAKFILNYAKSKYRHIFLLGFSMGGAIAINCLDENPEKLILISPATHMADKSKLYFRMNEMIEENISDLHGLKLSKAFVDSFKILKKTEPFKTYKNPVLLIQGTHDQSVPLEGSKKLATRISDCRFVEFEGADHGYGKVKYRNRINEEVIQFITE